MRKESENHRRATAIESAVIAPKKRRSRNKVTSREAAYSQLRQALATPGPYTALLKLAGKGRCDFIDVSSNKYKHLGQAYAKKTGQ